MSRVVPLAFTKMVASTEKLPYLVFIHGLDSTRFTWKRCMEAFEGKYNMIAVDLRGHGETPFGNEEDFSASMLVEDIKHTLVINDVPAPFVLIGHSMGGRVAMKYGATYPQHISSLVIEDMDIRKRQYPDVSHEDLEQRRILSNNREFPTFDDLEKRLQQWYDIPRIQRWADDGRVFLKENGGQSSWWCGVNPLAQHYARITVLEQVGELEWTACGNASFPMHLFVAGSASACSDVSVEAMCEIVPRTQLQYFFNSEHSIHRTGFDNFLARIEEAIFPEAVHYMSSCQSSFFDLKNEV